MCVCAYSIHSEFTLSVSSSVTRQVKIETDFCQTENCLLPAVEFGWKKKRWNGRKRERERKESSVGLCLAHKRK